MKTPTTKEKFLYEMVNSLNTLTLGQRWDDVFDYTEEYVPGSDRMIFRCIEPFYYVNENVIVEKDDLIYWTWSDQTVIQMFNAGTHGVHVVLHEYK